MHTELRALIESFAGLRTLVIGEAMLDSYLEGSASALCREAPVPVVKLSQRCDKPGGAANAAANLRALGAPVTLLSVVGADAEGERLRALLDERGIDTGALLARPARQTLAKHRVVAGRQLLVRFDQGSTEPMDRVTEQALIARLNALFPRHDAILISDYGYGVLTSRVIAALARLRARYPRVVVADARRLDRYRDVGLTAAKPNYVETAELLPDCAVEDGGDRAASVARHGEDLLTLLGARLVAVTLDEDGALLLERGSAPYRTYAPPAGNAQVTGAGDTFVGALTLALAAGAPPPDAAELASAAAAVAVAKDGTATCSGGELWAAIAGTEKYVAEAAELQARLDEYRSQGRQIVFTNGCFDIIHRGHVTFLTQAKALGDVLVVGLNSDASVRRLKGATRPINGVDDRAQVLAALSCVDLIVPFEEDTPLRLIGEVRPQVYVKGGDYTRERLPEAPLIESLGGRVEILPYLAERSTTGIIERIRARAVGGR